ncbi:hypothetical protein JXA80_11615 [bacterium]|nr:hypothetical protein [candidate division CSSED10-310 bacterium]
MNLTTGLARPSMASPRIPLNNGSPVASTGPAEFGRIFQQTLQESTRGQTMTHTLISVLDRLNDKSIKVTELLQKVISGQEMKPCDLLAVQGVMLNFNRDLTLVSKLLEQIVNGIKNIIQTQV